MTETLCTYEFGAVLYSDIAKITKPEPIFAMDRISAVSAFVWLKGGTQLPYFSRGVDPSNNSDEVLCEAKREYDLRIDQWRTFLARGLVGAMLARTERDLAACNAELNAHKRIRRDMVARVADAIACLESPYAPHEMLCVKDALKHLKDIKLEQ